MPITNFLIKPSSHLCNIDCTYCFYKRAQNVYPDRDNKMSTETADVFMKKALGQGPGRYSFCWQGGEPTLMGLEFFEHIVRTQHELAGPGQVVENSLQTNGLLLNTDWSRFLRKNRFLVGLSLDGPKDIHDRYRVSRGGNGTFDQVMESARLMVETGVDFNILTLLTNANICEPGRLYRFYRENGFDHLQLIPCLEKDETGKPLPFSVSGNELGAFYMNLFDLWLEDGFPHVSIRLFEDILLYLLDGIHASCGWQGRCDSYLLVEHTGDCYPCDFFVYPQWLLGNITTDSMEDIAASPVRSRFANLKSDFGPACRSCRYFAFCQGDCTRHRLTGENRFGSESEYCSAWKMILDYITNHPKNIREMAMEARAAHQRGAVVKAGRNDPCPCGSGKKYKKCCGRAG